MVLGRPIQTRGNLSIPRMFFKMRTLVGEGWGAAQVLGVLALGRFPICFPWEGRRRTRARPLICKSSDRGTALTLEPQDAWGLLAHFPSSSLPPSVCLNFGVACVVETGSSLLVFLSQPWVLELLLELGMFWCDRCYV